MLVSIRTAPKPGGIDDKITAIIYSKDKDEIAAEIEKMVEKRDSKGLKRNGKNLRGSRALVT